MPLYEYQCEDCGHRLEALQKMSDDRLVFCPECNEPRLKKLISAAAFQLKGTGWYETDFKNSDKKKPDNKTASNANTESKTDSNTGSTPDGNKSEGSSSTAPSSTTSAGGGSDKSASNASA